MDHQKRRIAVFGAGGHGKVVVDAIECSARLDLVFVVDDYPQPDAMILGRAIAGGREALLERRDEVDGVIVAIGDNRTRIEVARWLAAQGFDLLSVEHPAAIVARTAVLGAGTLIMPGAVVNADAHIGENSIVNSGAIVEHDCGVGEGVHVAPGAVLCGGSLVGACTLIGAGAVVLPGVRVGSSQLIKAGTVVARDVEAGE